MKTRIFFILICISLILGNGFLFADGTAVIDDDPVYLLSPQVEAMGGSYVPIASGYEALFTNPAGLSRKGGQLTFAALNVGPYFLPTQNMIDLALGVINDEDVSEYTDDLLSLLDGLDLESGVGTNVNVGFGLAAWGLGLGFLTDIDMLITQEGSAISMFVDPIVTSSLVAGISHGFRMGEGKLHIGADARGIARFRPTERLSVTSVINLLNDDGGDFDPMDYEFAMSLGYGFDAGAIMDFGSGFTVGATVNNIGGTQLVTANQTMAGIETAFNNSDGDPETFYDSLVVDTIGGYSYVVPMSITGGFGYDSPEKEIMDFKFSADYTHTFYSQEENRENDSFWQNVHMGAEINLLRILKVRGGINQGYFTFGGGVNLIVLELNAAYYSREMGNFAGQSQGQAFVVGAKVKL